MLIEAMAGYAGRDLNGESLLTHNDDQTVLSVISMGTERGQHFAVASLVARLRDDRVIIEQDINDKPLVDALVAAGVPRSRIVLAYAGEPDSHAA
jgi:hypothetical protein